MCWSKESSLTGFILNIIFLFLHCNNPSQKFIPIFFTVALTQLFDFLVYSGYNKKIIGKLLGIVFALQVFFIYQTFDLPKIYRIIPTIILFALYFTWEPYKNYKKTTGPISWDENNSSLMLFLLWILIPILHLIINKKNKKDIIFLITATILLFVSNYFTFGSVGKNWCMLGIVLNILTLVFYNRLKLFDL